MRFTYDSYTAMIRLLQENDYTITDYHHCDDYERLAILRHDVDNDLSKALKLAALENDLGVQSTYFLLLSSNFYNLFSKKSQDIMKQIMDMGHDIGLHFDETKYPITNAAHFKKYVSYELNLMEQIVTRRSNSLSMHRPSKLALEGNFDFSPVVNSYSQKFFKQYKYLSDSRMHWRENVLEVIRTGQHDRLHILTHPIWYNREERSAAQILRDYLSAKNDEMYCELSLNIRDIRRVFAGATVGL